MSKSGETRFCYHCGTSHPVEEMKRLVTKTGTRWRCIKSIQATRQPREARDEFGRRVTAQNKSAASSKARISNLLKNA